MSDYNNMIRCLWKGVADTDQQIDAADRIEQLEERLENEMQDLDAADRRAKRLQNRIEELEAKMAKAVDVIEWVLIAWDDHHKHGYNMQGDWEPDARTTLAELTGGKDE